MQFVWFNVPGPADGLELKLSMRSVVQNVEGTHRLTVLGDKPPWYRGHHIPCPRVGRVRGERTDRLPFRDTANKITVAASHPEVDEEWVWIMDDTYFLRPTTIDDLRVPRFDPWFRGSHRRLWHVLIAATFAALREKGYPTLQGATHLPHVFRKDQLRQMFAEFQFPKRLLLFELLYFNRYRENAQSYLPFLRRLQRPVPAAQLTAAAQEANVLNYVSSCWNKTTRAWLMQRFPTPTEAEG